jgi:hypothetical protein
MRYMLHIPVDEVDELDLYYQLFEDDIETYIIRLPLRFAR